MKKQNQRGITLIALIITIIVMLILVGVTINVALNGGLFTKADDATKLTQEAADKEELQLEIVTAYNEKEGTVDLNLLKTNLEKKNWKDVTISGDKLTCTSPKGNTFTVTADGKTSEENSDVKYYYTDYVEIRRIGYEGVFAVKELEDDYREAILYYSNDQESSYIDFSGTFRQEIVEEDTIRGNIEIKEGTVFYSDGGATLIIGDSIYLSDGPTNFYYEFRLTKLNDTVKNIIEKAK